MVCHKIYGMYKQNKNRIKKNENIGRNVGRSGFFDSGIIVERARS